MPNIPPTPDNYLTDETRARLALSELLKGLVPEDSLNTKVQTLIKHPGYNDLKTLDFCRDGSRTDPSIVHFIDQYGSQLWGIIFAGTTLADNLDTDEEDFARMIFTLVREIGLCLKDGSVSLTVSEQEAFLSLIRASRFETGKISLDQDFGDLLDFSTTLVSSENSQKLDDLKETILRLFLFSNNFATFITEVDQLLNDIEAFENSVGKFLEAGQLEVLTGIRDTLRKTQSAVQEAASSHQLQEKEIIFVSKNLHDSFFPSWDDLGDFDGLFE